jgi:integration host factor subunit alpha
MGRGVHVQTGSGALQAHGPELGEASEYVMAHTSAAFMKGGEDMDGKTLTKADIVDHIYEKTDRNRAEIKTQVEILLDTMKGAIKGDSSLLISGFGKFEAYQKKARKGRNPQTTQTITLPARKVIVFRLSRKFRADLNPQE